MQKKTSMFILLLMLVGFVYGETAEANVKTDLVYGQPPEADVKTRNCSPSAKAAINDAMNFIKSKGHELKNDFKLAKRKGQRRRIRRRFDRKIDKMRFNCAERILCRENSPRIALHPFGIAGRKIRVCYKKMIQRNYKFCDLVEKAAHEYGHAIGIPKQRLGGHFRNSNDRVYQFGWFAKNLCTIERPGEMNYPLLP